MQSEPKHPPCARCKTYIASKNCQACSAALCVECVTISVIKFNDSVSYKANSDYEFITRCKSCHTGSRLPSVQYSGSECTVQ
jgi:hypothetical protein